MRPLYKNAKFIVDLDSGADWVRCRLADGQCRHISNCRAALWIWSRR